MSKFSSRYRFGDWKQILTHLRKSIVNDTIEKLFENEDFVFDLLKLMYEDGVDIGAKTEYLAALEQYGPDSLNASSVDQATSTLLNMFKVYRSRDEYNNFCVQLLITTTTLLINSDHISREVYASFVAALWDVAADVNDVASRRIRGCCCQCLYQLEEFVPGMLWKFKDGVQRASREERSDVCQDYICLLAKVLQHMTQVGTDQFSTEQNVKLERFLSLTSLVNQELLPAVSFIMDVCVLLTTSALWNVVRSLVAMLRNSPQISPSIFKPLMIHHMATLDPTLLHIIVFLQMEYSSETLTTSEENKLLSRLVIGANHLALSPAHRLLLLQWIKGYYRKDDVQQLSISAYIKETQHSKFFPTVFDSLDVHAVKLSILTHCLLEQDCCSELLSSLQYLKKLVLVTGEDKAALTLFKSLFRFYELQDKEQITQAVLAITIEVLFKFPRLIRLAIDFLQCIRECNPELSVAMDILSSLHAHVLETSAEDILRQYEFYLQVFKTSVKEQAINQLDTLKCLHGVVRCAMDLDQCGWYFGTDILDICKNILLHHSTEAIYSVLGEMLFDMSHHYNDTDIRDRALLYYALLTGASDKKIQDVLRMMKPGEQVTGHNFTALLPGTVSEPVKTELIETDNSMFVWTWLETKPSITMKSISENQADKHINTDFISHYFNKLKTLSGKIEVKYSLKMRTDCEFEVIHAVSVNVETGQNYKPVDEIHIASFEKIDERQLLIVLKPKVPKPGCFKASVMFASSENKTHIAILPQLCLSFYNLFIPFPWQQLNVMKDSILETFNNLWDYFTAKERKPSDSIQSVKVLLCPLKSVQTALKQFSVNEESAEHCYAIFLPKRYHLLLKVIEHRDEKQLVVKIATDYWPVLPDINTFLESLR